jgi:predicted ATP-dependent endonuclease of OLD family
MHLAHLRLRDFRNHARLDVDFAPGFHPLRGDNAQGKTNILEAIYLLATLRSFRRVGGAQTGHKKHTAEMAELGIITPTLQAQLDALLDWRNNEHLFMLAEWEYGEYEVKQYNGAIVALRALRGSLEKWAITQDAP